VKHGIENYLILAQGTNNTRNETWGEEMCRVETEKEGELTPLFLRLPLWMVKPLHPR
jgi:hypothetical protein